MNNGYNNFQQQPPQWQPPRAPMNDGKGLSVTALVMGILGIIFGFVPFAGLVALVLNILGLVFSVVGNKKSKLAYGNSSGMAIAGLVLSIIGLVFAAIGTVVCTVPACTASCAMCGAANAAEELFNSSYYW